MKKERCIIIPAIKKNAVIPDQLVKKLAGVTLIQRAINTAKKLAADENIYVVTDSEEISLICTRNNVAFHYEQPLRLNTPNILKELKFFIELQAERYDNILIYRASAPLVDHNDIKAGYDLFIDKQADILVTLRKQEQCIWRKTNGSPEHLICSENIEPILIEIKSLLILKASAINGNPERNRVIPYYLNEKAIEINGYQDWWICEKLLKQKRILFVTAGYPKIGMGHIYRALTLAHEITDHHIRFLCTKESELAAKRIAEKDYDTVLQTGDLAEDVLGLKPDLVVNDILDTTTGYIRRLNSEGVKVVNFEDIGPGAKEADLVVNALYPHTDQTPGNHLCGPDYFCLRDEFAEVKKHQFHKQVRSLLITFGGTDPNNFTLRTIQTLYDRCLRHQIFIYLVTGPGYLHKAELENHLRKLDKSTFEYIHQTGVMSAIMEKADIAVSSAGRTVYELAHMRIPSVIMSHHEREDSHTFARQENGFEYIGVMNPFDSDRLMAAVNRLIDVNQRKTLHDNMKRFRFERNKSRVVNRILGLLEAA